MKPGDELRQDGKIVYIIERPEVRYNHGASHENIVVAIVRYMDGGTGVRTWDVDRDVPLTRRSK